MASSLATYKQVSSLPKSLLVASTVRPVKYTLSVFHSPCIQSLLRPSCSLYIDINMKLCSLAGLLVLFGTAVHGIPTTSASAPSTADCAAVDAILGVLSEDAAATSYCYSFLGSPTFTYTKTQQTKVATSTSTLYHTAIKVKASPSPITTTVTVYVVF